MDPLLSTSGSASTPVHVAIIMDGNGRWAKQRNLPRTAGHKQGAEAVRRAVRAAPSLGISYLTLFGFSSENWNRPESEIGDLMALLRLYLRSETAELHKNNVRILIIGDRGRLPKDIVQLIEQAESTTKGNTGLTAILALSYGGRQDITQAARTLARAAAAGEIDPESINEDLLAGHLATHGIPDPDLLIRTSGEQRISNFMIWQLAYTEFVFQEILWPDFDEQWLASALEEFRRRDRRYGASVGSS
ncbi:MAG: isoprenyl transferase [Alphaproteobacteria bacterium]|nr:isoprenyl transferase [Alphaproteobacteria bacterium]